MAERISQSTAESYTSLIDANWTNDDSTANSVAIEFVKQSMMAIPLAIVTSVALTHFGPNIFRSEEFTSNVLRNLNLNNLQQYAKEITYFNNCLIATTGVSIYSLFDSYTVVKNKQK